MGNSSEDVSSTKVEQPHFFRGTNETGSAVAGRIGNSDGPTEPDGEELASMAAQMRRFIEQARAESGPDADLLGRQLLRSKEPLLRVAGVAVLSELDGVDEEILRTVAADQNLSVLVGAIGWLYDTGNREGAKFLGNALRARNLGVETLAELMFSETLDATGQRALLRMLEEGMIPAEEAENILHLVLDEDALPYSVRMQALYQLRDRTEFESFRRIVNSLLSEAEKAQDEVWREGLSRLANRLKGPVKIHAGPPVLTPHDVEEMLARPFPMMLEDLALFVEYVIRKPQSYVQKGTSHRLLTCLQEVARQPLSEDEQNALRRLESFILPLGSMEKEEPVPPHVPIAPPEDE
ncbi:MAG: hypothetical protein N2255_03520 [Kiritimatiellae bacterium]|nr:hypothetical protein [Kiritimatiellia bacterium]